MKTNKKMKQSIIVLGAMFLLGTVGFAEYSIISNEISKSQQVTQAEIQKAIKESNEEMDMKLENGKFSLGQIMSYERQKTEVLINSQNSSDFIFNKELGEILGYKQVVNTKEIKTLNIPSEIEGTQVKSIGEYAFQDLINVTSVSIPDSVESIKDYAFYRLELTEIKLPENLRNIHEGAFRNSKFTTIKFPEKLEFIGNGAFRESKFTTIKFPDTLKYIDNVAFYNSKIEKLELNKGIKTIRYGAFYSANLDEKLDKNDFKDLEDFENIENPIFK